MMIRIRPTTEAFASNVFSPLFSMDSIPAKVKSSLLIVTSISAVYGALASCNTNKKIGFAKPINSANKALLAISVSGFSASVIGPPKARKSCQTVMRNRSVQAKYCKMEKAFPTNGKYSSIAVMSVPSASKNKPETASMRLVTIPLTQSTIPSKIQFSI